MENMIRLFGEGEAPAYLQGRTKMEYGNENPGFEMGSGMGGIRTETLRYLVWSLPNKKSVLITGTEEDHQLFQAIFDDINDACIEDGYRKKEEERAETQQQSFVPQTEKRIAKTYYIGDLLSAPAVQTGDDYNKITSLIEQVIEPGSWSLNGTDQIQVYRNNHSLIIKTTERTHEQIMCLLRLLRVIVNSGKEEAESAIY